MKKLFLSITLLILTFFVLLQTASPTYAYSGDPNLFSASTITTLLYDTDGALCGFKAYGIGFTSDSYYDVVISGVVMNTPDYNQGYFGQTIGNRSPTTGQIIYTDSTDSVESWIRPWDGTFWFQALDSDGKSVLDPDTVFSADNVSMVLHEDGLGADMPASVLFHKTMTYDVIEIESYPTIETLLTNMSFKIYFQDHTNDGIGPFIDDAAVSLKTDNYTGVEHEIGGVYDYTVTVTNTNLVEEDITLFVVVEDTHHTVASFLYDSESDPVDLTSGATVIIPSWFDVSLEEDILSVDDILSMFTFSHEDYAVEELVVTSSLLVDDVEYSGTTEWNITPDIYTIQIEVLDPYTVVSTFNVEIEVLENQIPEIAGPDAVRVASDKGILQSAFLDKYSVTSDDEITTTIQIISSDFDFGSDTLVAGEYQVVLRVTDSFDVDSTDFTVTITVYDPLIPTDLANTLLSVSAGILGVVIIYFAVTKLSSKFKKKRRTQ